MSNKYNPEIINDDVKSTLLFLTGVTKTDNLEFLRVSPKYMIELAKAVGVELDMDNVETNGWQVDYWIKGVFKNKPVIFSGSAWYGWGEIYWDTDSEDGEL